MFIPVATPVGQAPGRPPPGHVMGLVLPKRHDVLQLLSRRLQLLSLAMAVFMVGSIVAAMIIPSYAVLGLLACLTIPPALRYGMRRRSHKLILYYNAMNGVCATAFLVGSVITLATALPALACLCDNTCGSGSSAIAKSPATKEICDRRTTITACYYIALSFGLLMVVMQSTSCWLGRKLADDPLFRACTAVTPAPADIPHGIAIPWPPPPLDDADDFSDLAALYQANRARYASRSDLGSGNDSPGPVVPRSVTRTNSRSAAAAPFLKLAGSSSKSSPRVAPLSPASFQGSAGALSSPGRTAGLASPSGGSTSPSPGSGWQ